METITQNYEKEVFQEERLRSILGKETPDSSSTFNHTRKMEESENTRKTLQNNDRFFRVEVLAAIQDRVEKSLRSYPEFFDSYKSKFLETLNFYYQPPTTDEKIHLYLDIWRDYYFIKNDWDYFDSTFSHQKDLIDYYVKFHFTTSHKLIMKKWRSELFRRGKRQENLARAVSVDDLEALSEKLNKNYRYEEVHSFLSDFYCYLNSIELKVFRLMQNFQDKKVREKISLLASELNETYSQAEYKYNLVKFKLALYYARTYITSDIKPMQKNSVLSYLNSDTTLQKRFFETDEPLKEIPTIEEIEKILNDISLKDTSIDEPKVFKCKECDISEILDFFSLKDFTELPFLTDDETKILEMKRNRMSYQKITEYFNDKIDLKEFNSIKKRITILKYKVILFKISENDWNEKVLELLNTFPNENQKYFTKRVLSEIPSKLQVDKARKELERKIPSKADLKKVIQIFDSEAEFDIGLKTKSGEFFAKSRKDRTGKEHDHYLMYISSNGFAVDFSSESKKPFDFYQAFKYLKD